MKYLLIVFYADRPKDEFNYKRKMIDKKLFEEIKKSETVILEDVIYKISEKRSTHNILIIDVRLP